MFFFSVFEFNYLLSLLHHTGMGICPLLEEIKVTPLSNNWSALPHDPDCGLLITDSTL